MRLYRKVFSLLILLRPKLYRRLRRDTFRFVTRYRYLFSHRRPLLCAAFVVALLVMAPSAGALAQEDDDGDAPVITFLNPGPGDVISAPAFAVQFCFAAPVNILDAPDGGDFSISVKPPEGFGLGLRSVFQSDGLGVAVYANNADADPPEGVWTVKYRFTAPVTLTALEGEFTFAVDPDEGRHIPQATPPQCLASGQTATHGPDFTDPTEDPRTETDTPTPSAPADAENGDDDGLDILLFVLLAGGIASGVGLLVLVSYVVRRGA